MSGTSLLLGGFPFSATDVLTGTGIDGGGFITLVQGINSSNPINFLALGGRGGNRDAHFYRGAGSSFSDTDTLNLSHIDDDFQIRFAVTYYGG